MSVSVVNGDLVGKVVKVVKADTFGICDVRKEDTGIVVRYVDDEVIEVDIKPAGDFVGVKGWLCKITDVEVLDKKVIVDTKLRECTKDYIQFISNKSKSLLGKRDDLLNEITSYQDKILEDYKEIATITTLLRSHSTKVNRLESSTVSNKLQLVFDRYDSIDFSADTTKLCAVTKPITMTWNDSNHELQSISMGTYEIVICLDESIKFSIVKPVYKKHTEVSEIHPHILESGKPCWGNWLSYITKHLQDNDYLGLLVTLHDYLSSCNREGWYVSALAFGEDATKRCNVCWELDDNCSCDKCTDCGEHMDNCDCVRCPDSGDRIDEVGGEYCSGCSSLDSDGVCNC